jgi:hypothetical protein
MPMEIDFSAKHKIVDIVDTTQSIYRVCEISRLIDIFVNKSLSLTRPKLWDDPYENFLKYAIGIDKYNDEEIHQSYEYLSNEIFGQCWTLNIENDATWRIYSPGGDRVKVKTTIEKLSNFMERFTDDGLYSYIGKVTYDKQENIISKISRAIKNKSPYTSSPFDIESLVKNYYLVKRDVFDYENEVRLMVSLPSKPENYINSKYQDSKNLDICNLPLDDPEDFFDEIVFDPRMPDSLVRAFTSYFKSDLKYDKNIYKSTLYEKPYVREKVKSIFGK